MEQLTISAIPNQTDHAFYAKPEAFGRFGMCWLTPISMKRPHNHGHIEINWLSGGSLEYLFDGRPVTIPLGRAVLFWAGIPHQAVSAKTNSDTDRQCNIYMPLDSFLHIPRIEKLREVMVGGGIVCLDEDNIDINTLNRWYKDFCSCKPDRQDILKVEVATMLRRAALTGWDELLPVQIEPAQNTNRQTSQERHVITMVEYILENLTEPLTVDDVAKITGLNPNYALGLFTNVMRVPIRKFVVRMRLVHARTLLLESNLSIANVAFESGFKSLSQFYTHFNKTYGVTPLELRKD